MHNVFPFLLSIFFKKKASWHLHERSERKENPAVKETVHQSTDEQGSIQFPRFMASTKSDFSGRKKERKKGNASQPGAMTQRT